MVGTGQFPPSFTMIDSFLQLRCAKPLTSGNHRQNFRRTKCEAKYTRVIFGEKQFTSQPVCHQYKNEWLTLTYKSSFFTALLLSVYVQCVSTKIINDPKLTAAPRLSPPLLISGLKRRLLSDKRANWNVSRFNKYLFQRRFGIVHCNRRFVWNFTELQCLLDQNVKLLDGKGGEARSVFDAQSHSIGSQNWQMCKNSERLQIVSLRRTTCLVRWFFI